MALGRRHRLLLDDEQLLVDVLQLSQLAVEQQPIHRQQFQCSEPGQPGLSPQTATGDFEQGPIQETLNEVLVLRLLAHEAAG